MSSSRVGILTGADLVVAALERAGVSVAFGLPGVHNLALWRALGDSPIRLVGVRHEQAAAYAADGYARASGRLGVALTTTGPGAANTLGAVGEAWASRQPVLVIATDIPSSVRRPGVWRGVLHEATDQAAMFRPVVKEAYRVTDASSAGEVVAAAARTALAAPSRPVYVEVPTDLLAAEAGDTQRPGAPDESGAAAHHSPRPDERQLERALELLEHSRRPLVWAGGGALQSGAGEAVGKLAERLVAPVLLTYSARGLLAPGHPCLVEATAHVPVVGALWDEADLVVGIGTDFDAMTTQGWRQPQPPHLVAINVDAADASKNYRPEALIEGDAAAVTSLLAERLGGRGGHDALAERVRRLNADVRRELADSEPEASAFIDALEAALPDDAIVLSDMCIPV